MLANPMATYIYDRLKVSQISVSLRENIDVVIYDTTTSLFLSKSWFKIWKSIVCDLLIYLVSVIEVLGAQYQHTKELFNVYLLLWGECCFSLDSVTASNPCKSDCLSRIYIDSSYRYM